MKVCVIGSDGRAHVLAHVLGRTTQVVVTPGNPGIPGSVDTAPDDLDADLFVVSAEAPLVDGIADRLRAQGKLVYGPGADGARLEGSKAYMKDFVAAAGVPTADYGSFSEIEPALEFLRTLPGPWVVKTDGLAAGKGVLVTDELIEAEDDVRSKLAGEAFGAAGHTVVIEEAMSGPELSILAVCDGERAVALAPAQDFKRIGDGDTGPTPEAWARTRRCRSPARTWSRRCSATSSTRPWPSCAGGASTTAAPCTRGSCSPTRVRSWSSTTSASATPKPRSCSRG